MKSAALYARVSTTDGRQHTENQLVELRRFAAASGWPVFREYVDHGTGSKGTAERSALADLMRDAHARRFDMVIVFALDRLTREGVYKAFGYIQELKAAGVEFRSFSEPHFSTAGPTGEFFLAVAAWMAQQEREGLRLRINAGISRAKAAGVKFGRPVVVVDSMRVRALREAGLSIRAIAAELKTAKSTVERALMADPLHRPKKRTT